MKQLTRLQLEELHRIAHGSIDHANRPIFNGSIAENRLLYMGFIRTFEEDNVRYAALTEQGKAYLRGALV